MQAMATRTRRVALGLCVVATLLAAHAPLAHAQGPTARARASSTVAPSRASGALGPLMNIAQTASVVMTGQSTHFRSYGYLRLAWDELQLGRGAMARRALAQAAKQGANPIEVGWISREIARQAGA